MFKHIENIGDYFSGNYFTGDFQKKVIEKSGYGDEDLKSFESGIRGLKEKYFAFKKDFIELSRCKDQIERTYRFHTEVLNALGYDTRTDDYEDLFHLDESQVIPVRHKLYRGEKAHLFVMEMKALIKTGEQEPKGLFEQNWNRSQWEPVFKVAEGDTLTPSIINEAINELFLIDQHSRPAYVLLLAGNEIYLLHFEKWFKGSYLRFKLEDLFDEGTLHKEYYQLFYLLLSKNSLAPEADILLLEQLDEDSHKSAYAVTKDLKEGIIHAVELLANEALYYKKQILQENFDESDDAFEQQIKDDCLTMVYRLLFIFYAESRPDLGILPGNDDIYEKGYSLDMLRELEQVQLNSESSRNGYFFHESLQHLFHLLNRGYRYKEVNNNSFAINRLDTPLFDDDKFHHLKGIKFRNIFWQDIICQLSLSQKQRKKARGRISYANLGINQLGSVYEGLLAYRGFFAEQDYIEVHEAGNPNEGTFVVPRTRIDDFKSDEILHDEDGKVKFLRKGTFVYRLSGRDRQQSASYYTPEVLTRTTVKYTLKPILERLDKKEIKADDLLELKILEPAQGASAFQNEVVNQVAEAYLEAKQSELKKKVPAKDYQDQLQRVKAYIATNNVYGVDINPTAIELGKLSLWLNVIHKDMEVPYFGYRLGVGNAAVGSWLKVYTKQDFIVEYPKSGTTKARQTPVKKEWWEKAPVMRSFVKGKLSRKENEIYHFLLPDKNMVPSAGIKLLKEEFSKEAKAVSEWRSEFCKPIAQIEFETLQLITNKIDELLEEHFEFQDLINRTTGEKKNFFGHEVVQTGIFTAYDEKDQLAQQRTKHNAPYFKLKMVMDYWCALWFWDIRDAKDLPTRKQWYEDIRNILEIDLESSSEQNGIEEDLFAPHEEQVQLFEEPKQARLKAYRSTAQKEVTLEYISKYSNRLDLFDNERLDIVKTLAGKYRFFHNQLEFIEVFKERSGFDVIVGNPPWVGVEYNFSSEISEVKPEVHFRDFSDLEIQNIYNDALQQPEFKLNSFDNLIAIFSLKNMIISVSQYEFMDGRNNLYKNVLYNCLEIVSKTGSVGLVHPEKIFYETIPTKSRQYLYTRLKYLFQFQNEMRLFSEVGNAQTFSINIYSGEIRSVSFEAIFSLFHPTVIDGCFIHDGFGEEYGIKYKTKDGTYVWNNRAHKNRIIRFNEKSLSFLGKIFQDDLVWTNVKPIGLFSNSVTSVLQKLESHPKVDVESYSFSTGYNEALAPREGLIVRHTNFHSIQDSNFCISGPQFYNSSPFYQTPKSVCDSHRAYEIVDMTYVAEDFIPRTNYEVLEKGKSDEFLDWINAPKIVFPKMQNNPGERTLQCSIFPSGTSHIDSVVSLVYKEFESAILFCGLCNSLVYDFLVKLIGKKNFREDVISMLPYPSIANSDELKSRILLLNCVSPHFKNIWNDNYNSGFNQCKWSYDDARLKPFNAMKPTWEMDSPLRNWFERRQALVEIDVIVSMSLGITVDELNLIYNIQFPVLQQNEDDTWYDQKGNIVFTCSKGLVGVGLDRPEWEKVKNNKSGENVVHTITKSELYKGKQVTYYAPFEKCDRVEDYKRAWAHFEKRFN